MSLADRLAAARAAQELPQDGRPRRRAASARRDPFAQLKRDVHHSLLEALGPQLYDAALGQEELERRVRQLLQDVLAGRDTELTVTERSRLAQEIADDVLGYGPLEPLLSDPEVTEIMANGPDLLFVERSGRIYEVDARFSDEQHLRRTIDKIVGRVGRRVDEATPMVDARLPDGSRINAIIPPLAVDGPVLTVRKFATEPLAIDDLVSFGTMPLPVAEFLRACVAARLNIVVSGGTGAGKTTTLNVLSAFVPGDERIITVEDAAELRLRQRHVVRLEARPANVEGRGEVRIRDLVRNALRMRPDRIIVGEVRDAAALDMLQAMNTGHDGSISTVHSNSPRDAVSRLETMVLMGGIDLPVRAVREQIASAVDLIVHQARFRDGSRRLTHVTEVAGMAGETVTLQDVFVFDHARGTDEQGTPHGRLAPTGLRPLFLKRLSGSGVPVNPATFQPLRAYR